MRHKTRCVTLLCVALLPNVLLGQQDALQFNHLTSADGLSQSTVQAILQDSEGYMWFGTQDGLNKYNGYDMTVYKHNVDDTTTINGNDIRAIYEDSDNRLWIGTQSGALNLYDRDKDRFINYEAADDDEKWWTLSSNAVWTILEDSFNTFWVGTSYGLNIMNRETGRSQRIFSEEGNSKTLTDNQITVLFEDSDRTLWVGTANGLSRYNRSDSTFTRYLHGSGNRTDLNSYYINAIVEDSKGNFWIGTEESGLLQFDRENETFTSYTFSPDNPGSINDNSVIALLENNDGKLWVGTGNGGLNLMDPEDQTFTQLVHQAENPQSLSNNGVNYLYRGRDGMLWIGTFAGGVDFVDPAPPMFRHYKSEPVNPNSLSNNVVQSFFQDRAGGIWIGTDGGGLNLFDMETGEFRHYRHDPGRSNTISADVILDIYQNDLGLWLGTYGGGISHFDTRTGQFRSYKHNPNDPQSLSSNFVFVVTPKSDGTIWFGTNLGGMSVLNPQTGNFRRYFADPDQPNNPETITNNDIRSVFEDSNGDMWIGAYGGAVNRYDNSEDRFYLYDINSNSDLYTSVVQDFYEDRQGRLWLATRGGGLKQFIRKSEQFVTFSEKDGLPSNIIHAIEEDDKGNLWLSTNNGISRFNRDAMDFSNYNLEDGIQSLEFNQGSSLRDRDGYIYFGGVNGFNRFHPEDIRVDSFVPKVMLTDLHLFNEPVPIGKDSPLDKQLSQTDQLTLSHNASVITFEFAALDFSAQKGNQFAYKLEGFDEDWNYVGELRRATYTNLSPGRYMFKVKAANSDGVWSEETTSLSLIITPPFWQTVWFVFVVILSLVGLLYFIYRLRVRSIRRRNQMLTTAVAERTDELQKANATKDKLFSIVAHDLINISTGLSGLSGLMRESIENKNMDEIEEYSVHLHQTIEQFATMLRNMLDWARNQTGKIQYNPIIFDLDGIVEEVVDQEESRAIYKEIELVSKVDKNLEVYADPDMVMVILRNLVSNALKFTQKGGKIEIKARELENRVEISVNDNGIGMTSEAVQKVFGGNKESMTTRGTSDERGTGLGISICKDFVQRNKGNISVESELESGTTVSFTLPNAAQKYAEQPEILTQAS